MTQNKDLVRAWNPWWKEPCSLDFQERELYKKLQKFLPLKQMISITGLRRVGKTTLLYKIIEDSIKNGMPAKNILFCSFDNVQDTVLLDVLKTYEEIMEKPFGREKSLLILDEVQKLQSWQEQVKVIYDLYGKHVKIILSGSESLWIRKKTKESLAGRIFEFTLTVLTFKEFLQFKGIKASPVKLYGQELKQAFREFIRCQGFPEMVGMQDNEIIKKYIEEGIVDKAIYRDIPQLYPIKNPSVLRSIFTIIQQEPGQMIDLADLAKELSLSRQTVAMYLSYLEDAFLIRKLYNFSRNRRKVERKLKKYYPVIISNDALEKGDDLVASKIFECVVVNQMKAEFFWRDVYKNEVDMVFSDGKTLLPAEIKYGKIDTEALEKFMDIFGVKKAYVISSKKEEIIKKGNKQIEIVPAYLYLLQRKE